MSLTRRKTATYAGSAVIMAVVVILAANIYVGAGASATSSTSEGSTSTPTQSPPQSSSLASSQQQSSSVSPSSSESLVLLQLTDPPSVPTGTTSLNLTYSSISLLVGEPATNGKVTMTLVSVTLPFVAGSPTSRLIDE